MSDLWKLLNSPDAAPVRPWLSWHPSELDACFSARDANPVTPPDSAALEELRAAHLRWHADDASQKMLERLADPRARVVVAGQQPGLLAGPLLVVHKTLAAIHWARQLELRHGSPVVPVFWCASEDDDFDEVRRAHWPGLQGQLEEVLIDRLDPQLGWRPGRMMGTLPADFLGDRLTARIKESTHETEFRPGLLATLAEFHSPGASWEDVFCRMLLRMFAGSGLVIVSPLMRWVRHRGAKILRREFERPGESTRAVLERTEALRNAGFEPQLHRRSDAVNAFLVDEHDCRHSLRYTNGKFESYPPTDDKSETAGAGRALMGDELIAQLDADPGRFAFNAVTRPMVQDSVLSTVAQIVGPGEAAYLAQVEAAYPLFGVFAPTRLPRPQVALVPNSIARALNKYELDIKDALELDARALGRKVIERESTEGVAGDLTRMQERQIAELRAWAATAGSSPAIQAAVEKLSQAMGKGYETLRDRVLLARQEDERHLNSAMIKVENNMRPGATPQERVLNPVIPFVVNHGWDWPMRLAAKLDYSPGQGTQLIQLSELDAETAT